MKRTVTALTAIIFLTAIMMTGCKTDEGQKGNQNPFSGHFEPLMPVGQIKTDLSETGEGGTREWSTIDLWSWSSNKHLMAIDYDSEDSNTSYHVYEQYHYDSHGRLASLDHYVNGDLQLTFRFHYSDGLLDSIIYPLQNHQNNSTSFRYHSEKKQPYAIVFTRPLEENLWSLYHTDTLVQTWTLEWSNGNLVRATADSMAWYCTGISKIEYFYDNSPNPLLGWFSGNYILQNTIIDNPNFVSKNNQVRRVVYHYDKENNSTEISEANWDYNYRSDGYPASFSIKYNTLIWSTISATSYFLAYGSFCRMNFGTLCQ